MNGHLIDTFQAMDRMYGPQKRIYDLTRAYYLLGRDQMLREIRAQAGQTIADIGCGTGRNLAKLQDLYPQAALVGIDPSTPMLEVAAGKLGSEFALMRATAEDLPQMINSQRMPRPDHILFSYSLSIIPNVKDALGAAMKSVAEGGQIHIADFGSMARMPKPFGNLMGAWLDKFGVSHKPVIGEVFQSFGGEVRYRSCLRDYYEIWHWRKV